MSELISYHGDPAIKLKYVNRMKAHVAADELVRGTGWESNGSTKGCAVGCTLNEYNHQKFETVLGIPEWMARLYDYLHEHTDVDYRPNGVPFAQAFLESVPVGKNLDPIKHHIHIFIQRVNLKRVESLGITKPLKSRVIDAINGVIDVHQKALDFGWDESAAESAGSAAESAAGSAAWSAAWSAAESAAGSAAWSAAWSAAGSAESAAGSAESAARSAESAARSAESATIADELLRLLENTTEE